MPHLTHARRGAIVGLGGVRTFMQSKSGRRSVNMRLFLRPESVRVAPLRREGGELRPQGANNPRSTHFSFGSVIGFLTSRHQRGRKKPLLVVRSNACQKGLIMTNATTLTISDLNTALDDEPRVLDTRLAQSLGFARPRVIRELIERNTAELERYGSLAVQRGKSRGQEYTEYWLTEGQALCLAALSNAPRAPEARFALISVYMDYRRGKVAPVAQRPVQRPPCSGCAVYDLRSHIGSPVGQAIIEHLSPWEVSDLVSPPNEKEMHVMHDRRKERRELVAQITQEIASRLMGGGEKGG